MAGMTSQPSMGAIVACTKGTKYDTGEWCWNRCCKRTPVHTKWDILGFYKSQGHPSLSAEFPALIFHLIDFTAQTIVSWLFGIQTHSLLTTIVDSVCQSLKNAVNILENKMSSIWVCHTFSNKRLNFIFQHLLKYNLIILTWAPADDWLQVFFFFQSVKGFLHFPLEAW